MALLLGFDAGASCEEMTRAIETRGLAEPLAVVWHPCWVEHDLLVEMPRAEAGGRGRAGFQRQPFPVQPILRGRARGRDLVCLHGAPYSYQTVQTSARPVSVPAPAVATGPDGWESPGWALRWEAYTGGVRALRAGEHDLVSSADGTGLVPLAGEPLASARPTAIERADWVEAGPLRWAAEARARGEGSRWLRMEYVPGQHALAGTVGGAGWESGDYWWRLPLVDGGASRVLAAAEPGRIAAAWSISEPPGVLAVMLEADGELVSEPAPDGRSGWTVRWRLGDVPRGLKDDEVVLNWRLRWVPSQPGASASLVAARAVAALACALEVVVTKQHEGRLVAAGVGCTVRGPARWSGLAAPADAGRWTVPLALAVRAEEDVSVEIWLATAPAAAWWSPAPEAPAQATWSSASVIRHTLRLDPAALAAGPHLLLRIQW